MYAVQIITKDKIDGCVGHFVDYWPAWVEKQMTQDVNRQAQVTLTEYADNLEECPFCGENLHQAKIDGALIERPAASKEL
jgi:hypothetical protein